MIFLSQTVKFEPVSKFWKDFFVSNYNLKLIILLILMTVLFGLSFIATKNALAGMGVFQLVFSRNILAFGLLSLLLWRQRRQLAITRSDLKYFLMVAGLSPVGYFIFETFGLRYSNPASVALIIATIPIFTGLFSMRILKERLSILSGLGIVISLFGVYLLVSVSQSSAIAPRPVLGNMLTFGAAIAGGLYTIVCRQLTQKYAPTTITFYQTAIASLVFLPLALLEGQTRIPLRLDAMVLLNVAYLAVGCSVLAYFILNYTLRHLQATRVAVFTNLIPVITIFASWLLYNELLSFRQFIGAIFIIVGIYFNFAKKTSRIMTPTV